MITLMTFKILLVLLLIFIIINLAFALVALVKGNQDNGERLLPSHFLGKRLILSIIVVLLLLFAMASGLVIPHHRPY